MKLALIVTTATILLGCQHSRTSTINVWTEARAASQAEAEARGFSLHPCGASKEVRVSSLAPGEVEGTNSVVELDSKGEVVTRWATPIDVLPIAVRGNKLYVSTQTEVLEISSAGDLRSVHGLSRDSGQHEICQQALDMYVEQNNTADACWTFIDPGSGQPRNIAFPLICT